MRCYIRRLAHRYYPVRMPMGEVVRMGNDFRNFLFRFVVCAFIVLMILLLTAPKAC